MDRPAFRTWIRLALPLALGLTGSPPAAQAQSPATRTMFFPATMCQPEEDEADLRREGVRITNNSTSTRNRIRCPVAWPLESDLLPLGHVTLSELEVGYVDDNGTPNLDGELSCRVVHRSQFGALNFNALQLACAAVPDGGCNTDHGDRSVGVLKLPFSSWNLFDGSLQSVAVTCTLPKKWVVSGAGTFFSGLSYYRATFQITE